MQRYAVHKTAEGMAVKNGGFKMSLYYPEGMLIETEENKNSLKSPSAIRGCIASGKILEALAVVCDNEHNLIMDLGCMRGIIYRSEGAIGIADGSVRDIAIISRVNKPVCFKVIGMITDEQGKEVAVLSRRLAQEECMRQYISGLRIGDIIPAKVTHLETFGCFVDIGCGISSLIPIDAASVSRISHPRDRFTVGQNIRAVVKTIDDQNRISLTHKELLGNWQENAALFSAGETVAGTIRSIEEYGVFVELTPNLAGLAELKENVKIGQQASVYIKSLIPEKMKVKLIIVDAFDAAYQPAEYQYFLTEGHIDRWRYSPPESTRIVETVFQE